MERDRSACAQQRIARLSVDMMMMTLKETQHLFHTPLSDPTTFQIYLAAGAYMRKLVNFVLFVWKSFTIISGQRVGGFKRKIQIVDCNSMLTVKLLR